MRQRIGTVEKEMPISTSVRLKDLKLESFKKHIITAEKKEPGLAAYIKLVA